MDKDYTISEKLLNDYSSTNLFIFNGNESKENDYVYTMFNKNKKLKIIDATASLTYENKIEELWLDPLNCLTMANNIKKGFKEYISATYISNKIDTNYDELKIKLIQLEADYREMSNRANTKNIVVADDLFLYLKKYNINVISLEQSKNYTKKNLYDAEKLMKKGEIKVIYTRKGQKLNDTITKLKETYNLEVIELNDLYTLSEDDRKNNKDYFTLMYDNLELLKKQLYN
jgi:zinc transport system substrate-binding protein